MSRILVNGNCRFMENDLILCMTFADVYAAANHPDYRFTKSTRNGGTMPTDTKANPLTSLRQQSKKGKGITRPWRAF